MYLGRPKEYPTQGWWVWWAGRCDPVSASCAAPQTVMPSQSSLGLCPSVCPLEGRAFPSPPVSPPSPASAQGRFRTTAQAWICTQARRGQSGLVSEAENPGKSQQQVRRGVILDKDVAWCWRRCPGWDGKLLHWLWSPWMDSTHHLKHASMGGDLATCSPSGANCLQKVRDPAAWKAPPGIISYWGGAGLCWGVLHTSWGAPGQ